MPAGHIGGPHADTRTLSGIVSRLARLHPLRPVVLGTAGRVLTYRDLDRVVSAVHPVLRDLGVAQGDRVALVLPDGPATAAISLSIAANAVCAPLSPLMRPAELRAALARLRPRAVVVHAVDSPAARVAADMGTGVLLAHGVRGALPGIEPVRPPHGRGVERGVDRGGPAVPEDTAFLLSTSGSTATPKLVPLTHRNAVSAATATTRAYRLTEEDRRLNFMSLHHVQGMVGSVLASVVSGGAVMCLPAFNPAQVGRLVREAGLTWYSATPTMHRELLAEAEDELGKLVSHGLRFVRAGSAALPPALRARLVRVMRVPVVESYGMTEAHQISSTPMDEDEHRAGTVGRPAGADVAIMAVRGETLLAPGRTGEVVIRGNSVMPGYADAPEVNAEVFAAGWFRTGDLGCLDQDGYLSLRGRLKEIINRGGEKISPREVDDALLGHPAVAEAMTFPVPDTRLGEDVGAVVVPAAGHDVTPADLRKYALERMAPHKAPRRIALVARIPTREPGTKPRRKDLADLLGFTEAVPSPDRPVSTGTELSLSAIWCQVLKLREVGPDEDFFFLGGDSISGAQILTMVDEVFGVALEPFSMYDDANTVRGMAELITAARGKAAGGELDAVTG